MEDNPDGWITPVGGGSRRVNVSNMLVVSLSYRGKKVKKVQNLDNFSLSFRVSKKGKHISFTSRFNF